MYMSIEATPEMYISCLIIRNMYVQMMFAIINLESFYWCIPIPVFIFTMQDNTLQALQYLLDSKMVRISSLIPIPSFSTYMYMYIP